MKWELFVDESGDFEVNRHCVVGGFLCPEGVMTEAIASSWKFDILHDSKVVDALDNFGKWNFDHCCENRCQTTRKKINRGILQTTIVEAYSKKLSDVGGRLVIFDNPSGTYNIDNTTNFLTVLAKGLLMMFYDLQGEMSSLKVHFASRRNNTRQDDPKALTVSPTRIQEPGMTDQGTILGVQYAKQLKNLAFLQGGQWLINNPIFSNMIDTIDIIGDRYVQVTYDAPYKKANGEIIYLKQGGGDYDKIPNPLTVPCDYICNTFYKANDFSDVQKELASLSGLYSPDFCLYYQVDRPIQNYVHSDILDQGATGEAFLQLFSLDFPEPQSSNFFKLFNASSPADNRATIDSTISGLFPLIDSQQNINSLISRLEHAIEVTDRINNNNHRHYLNANLLLYLQSLYTHLGNQQKVTAINEQVHTLIDFIDDEADIDKILDIADNRHLVDLTDLFAYNEACSEFDSIQKYWKSKESSRRNKSLQKPRYLAYGKAIGSYLQVLRHKMHMEINDTDEKELLYLEASELYGEYLYDIGTSLPDQSRCYQIMCDIESEMGNFDNAIHYLYYAALCSMNQKPHDIQNKSITEISDTILEASGFNGSQNPYLLQHFVRMAAMMEEAEKWDWAESIIQPYLTSLTENIGTEIKQPHPRTQILWKTATILALRPSSTDIQRRLATELYERAAKDLLEPKMGIFAAITVGIKAEQTKMILQKKINGNASVVQKALHAAYMMFLDIKADNDIDPFAEIMKKYDWQQISTDNVQVLTNITSKIGY